MSLHEKHPHLVAYDISDPKRLSRVHCYLKRLGIPLQYSVFLLYVTAIQRKQIAFRLNRLIDPRADDVRIYPLPKNPDWQWWGRPMWVEGVTLCGIPLPEGLGRATFKNGHSSKSCHRRQLSGVKNFPQGSLQGIDL